MSETVFIYPGWSLRPVAGRIGAEISGLRLSGDLPDETVAALRRALNHHKVLFFRGQGHLDDVEQEAFGRLFGEIVSHPTIPPNRRPNASCSTSSRWPWPRRSEEHTSELPS